VAEQFYPHLRWGVIRGDLHTTTVGCVPGEQGFPYFPGFGRVVVVSDILLSCGVGDWTAENCIAYALFSKFCCEGLDERVIIARQEDATYNEILEILSVIEEVFYLNVNSNTAKVMEALSNGQLTLAEKVSRW